MLGDSLLTGFCKLLVYFHLFHYNSLSVKKGKQKQYSVFIMPFQKENYISLFVFSFYNTKVPYIIIYSKLFTDHFINKYSQYLNWQWCTLIYEYKIVYVVRSKDMN